MPQLVRDAFAKIKAITGVTAIDASADSIAVNGQPITFQCVSGNIWINPNATAVANATAFKMTAGMALDLIAMGNLSIISDGSGGTWQMIIWDL